MEIKNKSEKRGKGRPKKIWRPKPNIKTVRNFDCGRYSDCNRAFALINRTAAEAFNCFMCPNQFDTTNKRELLHFIKSNPDFDIVKHTNIRIGYSQKSGFNFSDMSMR